MIQFLTTNKFDGVTVSALSEASAAHGASNVQDRFLKKTWRSSGLANEWLKFDLGSAKQVTLFTFFKNNFTSSATVKLYAHASDLGSLESSWAGVATYEATVTSFDQTVGVISINQTLRYWLLAISDATNTDGYVEIGRVFAGVPTAPSENFNEVFSEPNIDPSDTFWTQGMHQYSVERETYKQFEITFNDMPAADQTVLRNVWAAVHKREPFVMALDLTQYPVDLTRYGVFTSDLNFSWAPNNRVNCPMSFRELK
jgi:hypothetical protein